METTTMGLYGVQCLDFRDNLAIPLRDLDCCINLDIGTETDSSVYFPNLETKNLRLMQKLAAALGSRSGTAPSNNHILTQNLYYTYYYPKPKYLIIGYMDPKPQTPMNHMQVKAHTQPTSRDFRREP